jgi:SAM-dependent methyltransferase
LDALGVLHGRLVFARRIHVLAKLLADAIPARSRVLDVGCGGGQLDRLLLDLRHDLEIQGIDVLVRPGAAMPVAAFDGRHIPHGDKSFDVVMMVDVLHHTEDPAILLGEAKRVARRCIVIKDHCRDGFLAEQTLRFMDWVGNAPHGIALPYRYWPEVRWRRAFEDLGLRVERWVGQLGLYPWPFAALFGRQLHFIARLRP